MFKVVAYPPNIMEKVFFLHHPSPHPRAGRFSKFQFSGKRKRSFVVCGWVNNNRNDLFVVYLNKREKKKREGSAYIVNYSYCFKP